LLSEADLNIIFYMLFLLSGLPISYKYAAFMVKHTGMVVPHFFISLMLNLCVGILGIVGWIFFAPKISIYFTLGGIFLGAGITALSLLLLLTLLLYKRKALLLSFQRWIST
jgi:ABC-type sulfate transport system permease component